MKKVLIVVDMQNDFITGALANPEGQKIVTKIADYIKNFDGDIIATQDTHTESYLNTLEGKNLPVPHCIINTDGWKLVPEIAEALKLREKDTSVKYREKFSFGCPGVADIVARGLYDEVILCGVCTDICVISNALLIKAFSINTPVKVIADLCAGVTPESHNNALKAMQACQVEII